MYIFVEKINSINLIFFIFFRIFGIKIYFFSLSNILKKKKFIYWLNKINICFINFSQKNFDDDIPFGTITNLSRDILIQNVSNYCEKIDFSLLKNFFLSPDILKIFFIRKYAYSFKNIFFVESLLKNLELEIIIYGLIQILIAKNFYQTQLKKNLRPFFENI